MRLRRTTLFFLLPLLLATAVSAPAESGRSGAQTGAKDLFYAQLSRPTETLNNGIQYWIELKRGNATRRVTNKFGFQSGDEIRFHLRTNTNAYAYLLLSEGSGGEHALLFPAAGHADDNRLRANAECSIPGDDFIVFDANPGTEKVTVLLSRKQLDANQFLQKTNREKVVIASASGSKDLIPGSCVVTLAPADTKIQAAVRPAVKTASASSQTQSANNNESGVITVVQRDPAEVLTLDIFLTHSP